MSRSTPLGEPHDWVTRAADDAIRHHEKTGAAGPVTCSSGISPVGPGPPGQPARVPDAALRRRRAAPPRRTRAPPARAGTTTTGSARCRPASTRRGPSTSADRCVGVPDPWGCHASWSDPLQGAAARDARRAGRRDGGDLPDRALPARASTATRCCARSATAHEIDAVLAQHRTKKAEPEPPRDDEHAAQEAEALADSVANDDEDADEHRRRLLPVQALLPRLRPRHDHGHGVRRRDDRPRLHLLGRATTTAPPTSRRRTRASWSGRSTGRCAGPSSTSTSSRPAWTTRRPGSSFTVGHELVESVWDYPRAGVVRLRLRRLRRRAEDVVVRAAARPTAAGRAAGARAGDPALALRPPPAQAGLRHRLRPRGRAAVRRVGRAGAARPPTPTKRDAQVLAYERASATATAGHAADAGGRRAVPDARRRSPT